MSTYKCADSSLKYLSIFSTTNQQQCIFLLYKISPMNLKFIEIEIIMLKCACYIAIVHIFHNYKWKFCEKTKFHSSIWLLLLFRCFVHITCLDNINLYKWVSLIIIYICYVCLMFIYLMDCLLAVGCCAICYVQKSKQHVSI